MATDNWPGEIWTVYREAVFDRLRDTQNEDGGWPAGDGPGANRVHATAVWCTILQFERNRFPSMGRVSNKVK